jgi:hypothetical protein
MRARLAFPLAVAFAAAFAAQVEGVLVTRWASDRGTACSSSGAAGECALNGVISFLAGTFFAVETLAATLIALVLHRNGKRFGAAVAAAGLVLALGVEHLWLLTHQAR